MTKSKGDPYTSRPGRWLFAARLRLCRKMYVILRNFSILAADFCSIIPPGTYVILRVPAPASAGAYHQVRRYVILRVAAPAKYPAPLFDHTRTLYHIYLDTWPCLAGLGARLWVVHVRVYQNQASGIWYLARTRTATYEYQEEDESFSVSRLLPTVLVCILVHGKSVRHKQVPSRCARVIHLLPLHCTSGTPWAAPCSVFADAAVVVCSLDTFSRWK